MAGFCGDDPCPADEAVPGDYASPFRRDPTTGCIWLAGQPFIICTSSTRPASPFEGLGIIETNTTRLLIYNTVTGWTRIGHYTSTGRTGGRWRRVANQSISNISNTLISWDTEDADSDAFLSVTGDTLTIQTGLPGLYLVTAAVDWAGSTTSSRTGIVFVRGGTTYQILGGDIGSSTEPSGNIQGTTAAMFLAAADTIAVEVRQASGGSLNLTARLDVARLQV